ncbi:MAG TPA: hypothetical protein DCP28_00780, partial [Cytophagales bacterium]|nr:hypothetical protein [Cytophagales bacterium]
KAQDTTFWAGSADTPEGNREPSPFTPPAPASASSHSAEAGTGEQSSLATPPSSTSTKESTADGATTSKTGPKAKAPNADKKISTAEAQEDRIASSKGYTSKTTVPNKSSNSVDSPPPNQGHAQASQPPEQQDQDNYTTNGLNEYDTSPSHPEATSERPSGTPEKSPSFLEDNTGDTSPSSQKGDTIADPEKQPKTEKKETKTTSAKSRQTSISESETPQKDLTTQTPSEGKTSPRNSPEKPIPDSSLEKPNPQSKKAPRPSSSLVHRPSYLSGAHFVHNAGLVLLWPYLSHFYKGLGIMTPEATWASLEAHNRAVYLLQAILQWDDAPMQEPDLLLNKILTGWPLEEPLHAPPTFTEEEREETRGLLQAVLNVWDKGKGTSPEGFAGTFLLREGRLEMTKNEEWELTVESRTLDLILNSIPWPRSLVKLSWMDTVIHVQW